MSEKSVQQLPLLITVTEAAHLLGYSKSKLYDMIARREFPVVKSNGALRVNRAKLPDWIERHTQRDLR